MIKWINYVADPLAMCHRLLTLITTEIKPLKPVLFDCVFKFIATESSCT
jgi:hypothetical protein